MKTLLKLVAVAAAFGLGPAAAIAQPSQGTAAQTTTPQGQPQERVAPAASQTAMPTPAVTGQPSEAATQSTANAPSAETKDVPAYSTPLSARENVGERSWPSDSSCASKATRCTRRRPACR